ncbi:MFS transporter (plasmid) [Pseudanabaena biceps]|nr:MFS transporter [Pseudanabaena biceps]
MAKIAKKGIFNNIFFIGLLSFFGGISQDIFVPILPLYLSDILGMDKSFIGLTEGIVTSSASIFKIVSGFLTDKLKSKKSIIFVGYFLSLISRPLLAVISSSFGVLALRLIDGIGKGLKDAPKDALIADSTLNTNRGKSFGVARALDTMGSVIGPLILFGLLFLFQTLDKKYEYIFFISALPLVLTLLVIVFKVKETPAIKDTNKSSESIASVKLPTNFYILLGIMCLFSIGNSSDAFLILRAQNVGVELLAIPLVYALFNFFYATASIPLGSLSDRIGREKVIILGWIAYALAYLGFGFANAAYQIWLLFAFYGIYYATTEGVAKALIADLVDSSHRGRAYGLYNSVIGLMALPSSLIAGFLWDKVNSGAPFLFGACIAILSTLCLGIFLRFKN